LEQLVGVVLLGFLTTHFYVFIIYTGAKDKTEDDDDDADSVLGGESQVMLAIYDNADVDVDEEEIMGGENAETSELSAQGPVPTREKMAAEKHEFEGSGERLGSGTPDAEGNISATENTARPKLEHVSPAALFVHPTAPPEKAAPAVHLEDAKLPGATGARGNIQPDAAGSSKKSATAVHLEDTKLPGATGARDSIQPGAAGSSEKSAPAVHLEDTKLPGVTEDLSEARGNIRPGAPGSSEKLAPAMHLEDTKLPDVTGVAAGGSSEAQQPTAAVAAAGKDSNLPREAELLSVAAEGARKEPKRPRNAMLVGKTTNDIQSGKIETTFSAFDLPLPSGTKRKKKKKKQKA
jgi:hypothetical protein